VVPTSLPELPGVNLLIISGAHFLAISDTLCKCDKNSGNNMCFKEPVVPSLFKEQFLPSFFTEL